MPEHHKMMGPLLPSTDKHVRLRPMPGGAIRLRGGFWAGRQLLNREVTIPHGMHMLEEAGNLDNLRLAAGLIKGEYRDPLFRDSDVYKVLEAIAWERQHGPDADQDRFFASSAQLIAAAQAPDGYLNSHVQVCEPANRFGNPAMNHELYCAGHLFQATVAEARSGGGPSRLRPVTERFADYLQLVLTQERPLFVPGHPEIETALVELYRQTGTASRLDLASSLLRRRGQKSLRWRSFGPEYFQDDLPLTEAGRVRGHAVRALYLLSGAADAFMETGQDDLLRACLDQWQDAVSTKTYITGGMGSRHQDEAFGEPFELPSDRAYCETCASIASIMLSWRLTLATGDPRFADLAERTLYNGFLSGWGLDGKSFFYVNPLKSSGGRRQPWFWCVSTGYPFEAAASIAVTEAPEAEVDLAVRVPSWARDASVVLNDKPGPSGPDGSGYLSVSRKWRAGDNLVFSFPVRARVVRPDPRIDAIRSCVALERGPLVYCVESTGPGRASLDGLELSPRPGALQEQHLDIAGHPVVALRCPVTKRATAPAATWPYDDGPGPSEVPSPESAEVVAIPYFARANRGEADMRVWLPASGG
ncbi:MAG: beta-L-arabinofuranosidase domain-containing protein [Acidimicrobiales bacterium]